MSKVFAVFGATGKQGGSIVDFVVNDAELSKEYKVRAITRDTTSGPAKKLAEKVEVVTGDATDPESLKTALAGVHTVFILTNPTFGEDAFQAEFQAGKAMVDAAVAQGAKYLIFSSLPAVKEISNGKYTKATNFDAKAAVEKYIRGLPVDSAFYHAGEFMENFHNFPFYALEPQPDGSYVMSRNKAPTSEVPLVATEADTGKFIGAILADPQKFEGKVVAGATRFYTLEEIVADLSRSTGKKVVFKQVSDEEYKAMLPDWVQGVFMEVMGFIGEYGYFGPGGEKIWADSAASARGKLTTFKEFLRQNPIKLE